MSKNKKGLHVCKSAIFQLKIGKEQKKDLKAACSLPSSGVGKFFIIFFKISLFATRDVPDSKFAGLPNTEYPANLPYRISGTGPQPGSCRQLIYNNVVLRYFFKMLFLENTEKIFVFALLSLFEKSYRNIE